MCPFVTRCLQWVLLQVPESIVVLVTWDYPLFGVVLFSVFVSFALRNFLLRYLPRKLQLYFIKMVFDNILAFFIIAETFHSLRDTYTRLHEPVASFMTYDKPTWKSSQFQSLSHDFKFTFFSHIKIGSRPREIVGVASLMVRKRKRRKLFFFNRSLFNLQLQALEAIPASRHQPLPFPLLVKASKDTRSPL